MRRGGAILSALIALGLAAGPSAAVEGKPRAKPPPAQEKPAAGAQEKPASQPAAPPYEGQMLRLAEIMGSLAYLRELCGDGDGGEYRARMNSLMQAESHVPELKEKLAGAYNRGYRGYQATYRQCTPNAGAAIKRYLAEGERIAHEIAYRYGGT